MLDLGERVARLEIDTEYGFRSLSLEYRSHTFGCSAARDVAARDKQRTFWVVVVVGMGLWWVGVRGMHRNRERL